MPLVPLQDIIVIQDLGGTATTAVAKLKERLKAYPEMRVVSIAIRDTQVAAGTEIIAVVEGVLKSQR